MPGLIQKNFTIDMSAGISGSSQNAMATDAPLEEFEAKHQELRREAWEAYQARKKKERLSQFPTTRIPITALAAFCIGTVSGAINGSKVAGLRFRAENAHRLPTSQKGWYYYHKSKNYNATWEAIKTGPKLGARMAFWAASFLLLEESLDHLRGDPYGRDCISTVLAAMTTSGAWSVWSK
jgi:hypothetical protein